MMRATRRKQIEPPWYELEDLPRLGWLTITGCGEENLYFTLENGTKGFVKVSDHYPSFGSLKNCDIDEVDATL
jgi:hypothetical protein